MKIDDANGTVIDESDYGNPYMFTGRRYDFETGIYYYRARYYNPYIGRFLQPDPIGYEAGLNLYTYVHNNPVNRVDPRGTIEPITCLACIACVAAFGISCTILCADDSVWDCASDTFSDCWNKCFKSIKKANKWVWWICAGTCLICYPLTLK